MLILVRPFSPLAEIDGGIIIWSSPLFPPRLSNNAKDVQEVSQPELSFRRNNVDSTRSEPGTPKVAERSSRHKVSAPSYNCEQAGSSGVRESSWDEARESAER